ncbi:MAG: DEAD/DEAH box helicase [Lachnospiraceae bacterium]|nr:DEAD/DEAH box helicase [Lachnospiraceae bacterium]
MKKSNSETLQFIFLPEGFCLDIPDSASATKTRKKQSPFEKDRYAALYQMGLEDKPDNLSVSASFLYLMADTFFKSLTSLPELELARDKAHMRIGEETYAGLERAVPFAIGAEYITRDWMDQIFDRLLSIFSQEITGYDGTVEMYLTEKSQHLRVPERIFFHLVENPETDFPFAFLATYATKGEDGKVRHMPLEYALTEYKGSREKLLNLLSCLNQAADVSPLIGDFMATGEMFHPLRLTAQEAYAFLKDIGKIEETGILCRIPNWWKKKASSVSLAVRMGEERPSVLGFHALVSMQPKLMVDGQELTEDDIRQLLSQTDGLALLKGKWIEVDHARLEQLLKEMDSLEGQVTLLEALQMEMGTKAPSPDVGPVITNGTWLSSLLQNLRAPQTIEKSSLPESFQAVLRPYQKNGFAWLDYMSHLGFGACLADDMGLGKTVQVLAYLEKLRTTNPHARVLLVVPASLLGNWQKEAAKFAPSMDVFILHGKTSTALEALFLEHPAFLTVTTYGMASRIQALQEETWSAVILDEAQAIKNPSTKQTREIKKIPAAMRIAMTGTPIENDLSNLWSLFDFLNKGMLGSSKEFRTFCKSLDENPEGYARLKAMVTPFMLRRVKTDKSIIADLPEKLEQIDYVSLSKKQVVLYRKAVAQLAKDLETAEGIKRKGLVLSTITHLKQICNHPDQYMGQQAFSESDSGKFAMLREICQTIYEKRERVLVFTQFKEITKYLAEFLEDIFHAKGFVLHGGIRTSKRTEIVEAFQGEEYVPFIVLSLKAAGTGLNLTKASHVIHFDRWWNPAVENQATDRAYRIGQTKNVMVHKLVCERTIEEKIDSMLQAKSQLAQNVIGSGGESWITELGNDELMAMMRLE